MFQCPQQRTPRRKIVHLTSVHPPFDVRIFHKECKSIARGGYDVTLIVRHDKDEIVEGIRLKAVPRSAGRIARMLRDSWAVGRAALREDADLYHFHDPELIPVALLMRLGNKRVVYDVHENVPADVACKHYIPRHFRRPLAWLAGVVERNASRFFSAIVPATDGISRRFAFRSGETVIVRNYPSLDRSVSETGRPWRERNASVVYTGLLSADRCIGEIVQAMIHLSSDLNATLVLAGSFSPPEYAREVAASKGWSRVRALGTIHHAQVLRLLSEARAGLCVYRPDQNNLDAVPTKLFEFMQAGIPVIASDFPGIRSVVSANACGLLVNPLDPKDIARAIEYVLNHPAEAEQMGCRGRLAVSGKFNWATEERKLLGLYADLLGSVAAG